MEKSSLFEGVHPVQHPENSGGMVRWWSANVKLALACDQEPGVQGRRSGLSPRSIHRILSIWSKSSVFPVQRIVEKCVSGSG